MELPCLDERGRRQAPSFRVITWDERGFGATEFDGQLFA